MHLGFFVEVKGCDEKEEIKELREKGGEVGEGAGPRAGISSDCPRCRDRRSSNIGGSQVT